LRGRGEKRIPEGEKGNARSLWPGACGEGRGRVSLQKKKEEVGGRGLGETKLGFVGCGKANKDFAMGVGIGGTVLQEEGGALVQDGGRVDCHWSCGGR